MSSIQFTCSNCEKSLEYGEDAAGLKVRCPECRTPLVVPETSAELPEPDEAPEEPKPKKKKKKKRRLTDESLDGTRPSHTPEWLIPVIMIVAGLLMSMIATMAILKIGPFPSLKANFIETIVSVPITLLAMYFTASLLGVSFGELHIAALKVAAIVIGGNGAIWICLWIGFPLILIWVMSLAFTFTFFSLLFDLDTQEAIVSIIIIVFCRGYIAKAIILAIS